MKNFEVIYKILRYLERAMDCDGADWREISAEKLEISQNRRGAIIEMLAKQNYIDGVVVYRSTGGGRVIGTTGMEITLAGLEYLHNNPNMKENEKRFGFCL